MNIAIIDDTIEDQNILKEVISSYYQNKQKSVSVHLFFNGEDFLAQYKPGTFELIFLDVYMNNLTGMDVAFKIREASDDCSLIFVTNSIDFAVSSYDVQATYYLLKPLDKTKLYGILDRYSNIIERETASIEVISDRSPIQIPVKSILYVSTFRNAIELHTDIGLIRTYMTFQKFEELISQYRCFLSCYRGCIVNMDRISQTLEDGFLMDNGENVLIRKRGSNLIKKTYLEYLFSADNNI